MEQRPITEYQLMLFTVFNTAALESGMGGFRYQTDEEATDELDRQIEDYRKRGMF